ncbi:GNAT family N-acetyltransferase [Plantactinospora siamensis]|uniref:GNAT family N-acetyltransferase n=1 Tax=Plantactinospora siamensis TaxID=555372 RepID=A0ABV6NRF0_9ACTN
MIRIRQFDWADYDAVVALWAAAGREALSRAELAAKLARDPELFLVAEAVRDPASEVGAPPTAEVGVGPVAAAGHVVAREVCDGRAGGGGGSLVGVVLGTFDGRRGWILRLAVPPTHRRRGVASLLVDELEGRFRRLGCPRVNLLVMPDNAAGLRFWQALGYLPMPDVLCTKPM